LACLLATRPSSDDGFEGNTMEIVKIYDYKPAWIARYDEGMIIQAWALHGGRYQGEGIA